MRMVSVSDQLLAFSEALTSSDVLILSDNHVISGTCTYLVGKGQQLFRPSQGAAPQSQQ